MTQTDPRIRALAANCAAQLKAIALEHDAQRKQIYRQFRIKAAQIQAEASAEVLTRPSAAPNPTTQANESKGIN